MCSVPRRSRFTSLGWDFCRMGALTIDMTAAWWALAGAVGRRPAGVVEGCFGYGSCVEPWCVSGLICRDTPGVVAQLRGRLLRIGGIARFVTTAYGGCAAHSGRVAADGGGVPWRRRSLVGGVPLSCMLTCSGIAVYHCSCRYSVVSKEAGSARRHDRAGALRRG